MSNGLVGFLISIGGDGIGLCIGGLTSGANVVVSELDSGFDGWLGFSTGISGLNVIQASILK